MSRYVPRLIYIYFFSTLSFIYRVIDLFPDHHVAALSLSLSITFQITLFLFPMSSLTCAGCDRRFTHAGYARHLSMTKRPLCRKIYDRRLDCSVSYDRPGIPDPENGNPSKCLCRLSHASKLTLFFRQG